MSTIAAAPTYRKTKTGEWVVYGPATLVHAGQVVIVTTKAGARKQERITRTGKPFAVRGVEMVYGYLGERQQAPSRTEARNARYTRGPRRACVTGGNCSSFGSGRSCGGHDCDGY